MARRLRSNAYLLAATIASTVLAGCASQPAINSIGNTGEITTSSTARAGYSVAAGAFDDLDCRRLNGRMQVRILQIRDRLGETQNPMYTALQSVLGVFQASSSAERQVDRATASDLQVLQQQNDTLKRKGCPQFDLSKELQPHPMRHTPKPTIAAAKSPAQ